MKNFRLIKGHVEEPTKLDKNFDVWKNTRKKSKIREIKKKVKLSFKKVYRLTKGHAQMVPEI